MDASMLLSWSAYILHCQLFYTRFVWHDLVKLQACWECSSVCWWEGVRRFLSVVGPHLGWVNPTHHQTYKAFSMCQNVSWAFRNHKNALSTNIPYSNEPSYSWPWINTHRQIRQGPILLVYFVESIAIPRASRTRFALRSVAVIFCDFKHGNHSPTRS